MAYKVKKKTNGRIVIKGIEFVKGKVVDVTKNVFDYITKTFKDMFEVVEQERAKIKAQEQTKPKPQQTKPINKGKKEG